MVSWPLPLLDPGVGQALGFKEERDRDGTGEPSCCPGLMWPRGTQRYLELRPELPRSLQSGCPAGLRGCAAVGGCGTGPPPFRALGGHILLSGDMSLVGGSVSSQPWGCLLEAPSPSLLSRPPLLVRHSGPSWSPCPGWQGDREATSPPWHPSCAGTPTPTGVFQKCCGNEFEEAALNFHGVLSE